MSTPPREAPPAETSEKPEKQRLLHLDVARGLGAILVVFGHNWLVLNDRSKLYTIIFSFHVPLFFFLSGVFFRPSVRFSSLAAVRSKSLLKPYLVTLALLAIDDVLLSGANAWSYFGGVAYASGKTIPWTPLWFLPHLWLLWLFALVVCRITGFERWSRWRQGFWVLGMLVVGVAALELFWEKPMSVNGHTFELPGLPLSMDLLLLSGAFFLGGYSLRDQFKTEAVKGTFAARFAPGTTSHKLAGFTERWGFSLVLVTFVTLHATTDVTMDINLRRYDHLVLSTLAAACGIYLALAIARWLAKGRISSKVLTYVGSASLFMLLFHHIVQDKAFNWFRAQAPESPHWAAWLSFALACIIPLGIFEVTRRVRVLRALYAS